MRKNRANGAGRLLDDLVTRQLFRRPASALDNRPCYVLWAMSVLHARFARRTEDAGRQSDNKIIGKLLHNIDEVFDKQDDYVQRKCEIRPYPKQSSMYFVAITMQPREHVRAPPPGCHYVVYADRIETVITD